MIDNELRNVLEKRIINSDKKAIVIEAATGVGKTLLALRKMKSLSPSSILIVVPKNVLKQSWKDEFTKWGYKDLLPKVTFTTYISFPKYSGTWDLVIFDEVHHLTPRCREAMDFFKIGFALFLSATIKGELHDFLYFRYRDNIEFFNVSTQEAIEENILPEPQIWLIPLYLDNTKANVIYQKKKSKHKEKPLVIPYSKRWNYRNYKKPLAFACTQWEYYQEISGLIEWYKNKIYNPALRQVWLHKCGERLQWLSSIKLPYTRKIIHHLKARYIVFCNTIKESQALNIPAVNTKVGMDNLTKFNNKQINSLAAVNMLNEGINLVDCQIGIFNAINASETYQIQKVGRELRHKSPILIIPYFKKTREEEIVNKWMKTFNSSIIKIKYLNQL